MDGDELLLWALVIACIFSLIVLFGGEPDLMDAIVERAMTDEPPATQEGQGDE